METTCPARGGRSDDSQIEEAGVGWQVDVLHVLHPRPADWAQLELSGTALAAHSVATRTEGRVDLQLAAHHAQHGFLQLAQLLLEHPGLLAAEALTATAIQAALGGLQGRVGRAVVASRDEVHNAGIIQSPPGVVIHLLRGSLNVEDILLAKVNVFIQKQRCQVALQVSAVLHHDGTGHGVTRCSEDSG